MKRVPFSDPAEVRAALPIVTAHLRSSGVIAYPTETVYGFGGMLTPVALQRVAELKKRGEDKPFLLLISSPAQCPQLEWNEPARKLAQEFWPGPLTLALRATSGEFPAAVLSGTETVAVRETSHAGLRTLLDVLGEPITSTSANLRGAAPAASADEAAAVLEQLDAADVLLLDGGALPAAQPSTLVDCNAEPVRVLRVGAISVESLRSVVEHLDA
ncbi:MAG TPA: L-threonylcarbamoyladenylate synthase [Longimicrobiales bacterium]